MNQSPLLVHPTLDAAVSGEYVHVTPQTAGWDTLHFAARRMKKGDQWQHETTANEYAIVILGGVCSVRSSRGEWLEIGRRPDVFSGMPYTLYLPRHTRFTLEATSDSLDIAYGWCAVNTDYPSRLVTPDQVAVEIRGGENASRQINGMIPPGFNCQRLIPQRGEGPPGQDAGSR